MAVCKALAKAEPFREERLFQFRGYLIEPERVFTSQELSAILKRSRIQCNALFNGCVTKKPRLAAVDLQDGTRGVLGSELIRYLKSREKRSSIAKRYTVIPHEEHPSLSVYSSIIENTNPKKQFSFADVDRLFNFNTRTTYGLVTSMDGKPPRFEAVTTEEGERKIPGKTVIAIAQTLANLPLEQAFVEEIANVLLFDTKDSVYANVYSEGGKAWFRYSCKREPKVIYYPVYYGLSGNIIIEKKHLLEMQNEISGFDFATIQEVCNLTGLKRTSITTRMPRDEKGSTYFPIRTLLEIIPVSLYRPYLGQIYFDKGMFERAKALIQKEKEIYVTAPELAAQISAEITLLTTNALNKFIKSHSRFENKGTEKETQVCTFKIGKQEFSFPVLKAKNAIGAYPPMVFLREDGNKIKKYFAVSKAEMHSPAIRTVLSKYLSKNLEAYNSFLKEISSCVSRPPFVAFGKKHKVVFSVSNDDFRVDKNDSEFVKFYVYMQYVLGRNQTRVFHNFEKDMEGKTLKEMEQDPVLQKKLALIGHVISPLSPEVVEFLSSHSHSFRILDIRSIPPDICVKSDFRGAPALYLGSHLPLPYAPVGNYIMVSKEDGLLYNLFMQGLDHQDETIFYQKFMKFSEWLSAKHFKDYSRAHVFALAIFRDYIFSGKRVLDNNLGISGEWQYVPIMAEELRKLDRSVSARLGRLSDLLAVHTEG